MTKTFISLAALLALSACSRESVETVRVSKDAAAKPAAHAGHDHGGAGHDEHASPALGLSWTLPSGWKEARSGGIRLATLTPPQDGGKAEASVVALEGDAGGELANVNRWRDQIGLPAIAREALASERRTVRAPAGEVLVYDLNGRSARFVVGAVAVGGSTWYFKLMGDEKAVGAHKPGFIQLLSGLKKDASS